MVRAPCCQKVGLKRGRWTAEEDEILINYIQANGEGSWRSLPKNAGSIQFISSLLFLYIYYNHQYFEFCRIKQTIVLIWILLSVFSVELLCLK